MKIEKHILELLDSRGKVAIADLGTFITIPASASMEEDEQVMRPPTLKVAFSEDTYSLSEDSIEKLLKEEGSFDEQTLSYEIEAFVKGVKNSVEQDGSCEVKGLGVFKKNSIGGLTFEQDEDLMLGEESFGLPKIEPKPLAPAVMTSAPPAPLEKESNRLMVTAIAIPLVVLFMVFLYFLYNRQAYESVMSYFSGTPAPITDTKKDDGNKDGQLKPLADNSGQEATDDKSEGGKTDGSKPTADKTTDNKKPASTPKTETKKPEPKTENTPSNTDMLVSSADNRYYVIIGSFSSLSKAKTKVAECRKIGYGTAKVVQRANRTRVSLEDFSSKQKAMEFAAKVGKDYPGAWVFTNG